MLKRMLRCMLSGWLLMGTALAVALAGGCDDDDDDDGGPGAGGAGGTTTSTTSTSSGGGAGGQGGDGGSPLPAEVTVQLSPQAGVTGTQRVNFAIPLEAGQLDEIRDRENVQWRQQLVRGKQSDMLVHCTTFDPDVFAVQETKLGPTTAGNFDIPGYTLYRLDRNEHGGGVGIYAKSCYKPIPITLHSVDSELLCVRISIGRKTFCVFSVYRSPSLCSPTDFVDDQQSV